MTQRREKALRTIKLMNYAHRFKTKVFITLSIGFFPLFIAMVSAESLPGFKLEGEEWTYSGKEESLNGILFKPDGNGLFPAVLVCHGTGSAGKRFAPVAKKFTEWGFVTILTDFTHADGSTLPKDASASPENLRRASIYLKILRNLPYVDVKRMAAFGHSREGMLMEGIAATTQDPATWVVTGAGSGMGAATESDFSKICAPGLIM